MEARCSILCDACRYEPVAVNVSALLRCMEMSSDGAELYRIALTWELHS